MSKVFCKFLLIFTFTEGNIFISKLLTKFERGYIMKIKKLCFFGNPYRESASVAVSTVGRVVGRGALFIRTISYYKWTRMRQCGWHRGLNKTVRPGSVFRHFRDLYWFISVHCGKCDKLLQAVGLYVRVVSSSVAMRLSALFATINYYISFSRVCNCRDRLHKAATLICSVARIYINMYRPKAKRAMISWALSERFHLSAAVCANESAVIFGKSFYFHY